MWVSRALNLPVGLAIILFGSSAIGAGSESQTVLDALPSETSLGPGWKRDITLLFDPWGKPQEIARTNLSESFLAASRARVEDPKGTVSGFSHTHFTFLQTNAHSTYDVQIERYRNPQQLKNEFDHLLNLDNDEYTKAPVEGLGDAAVLCNKTRGFGATLWFRRANFKVWIAPLGSITNWSQDARLQDLARKLDQEILKGRGQTGTSSARGKSGTNREQ